MNEQQAYALLRECAEICRDEQNIELDSNGPASRWEIRQLDDEPGAACVCPEYTRFDDPEPPFEYEAIESMTQEGIWCVLEHIREHGITIVHTSPTICFEIDAK